MGIPISVANVLRAVAPPKQLSKAERVASWILQIAVAAILGQTLFFKFTYAPETQIIFADLGGRPAATIVGIVELICVILLLVPATVIAGAALSLAAISGAIVLHLTVLGIAIRNPATGESDGGFLFLLAVLVALGSAAILAIRRDEVKARLRLLMFGARLLAKGSRS